MTFFAKNDEELSQIYKSKNKICAELNKINKYFKEININLNDVVLDPHLEEYIEIKILTSILKKEDIFSINNELISIEDIEDVLFSLKSKRYITEENNNFFIPKKFKIYKELFKLFLDNGAIELFFFSDYSQQMIETCFSNIETLFNADYDYKDSFFDSDNRNDSIKLLSMSPTSMNLLLFFDEIITDLNFNISSNPNGVLMIDSILYFGLFNDIYHYCDYINFDDLDKIINNENLFNKDYMNSRINNCRNIKNGELNEI